MTNELKEDIGAKAERLYSKWAGNHPTIHGNRMACWDELDRETQLQWIAVAEAALNSQRTPDMDGGRGLLDDGMCDDHGKFGCKKCLASLSRPTDEAEKLLRRARLILPKGKSLLWNDIDTHLSGSNATQADTDNAALVEKAYAPEEIEFLQCLLDRYSENGGAIDLSMDHPAFMRIVRKHAPILAALSNERKA